MPVVNDITSIFSELQSRKLDNLAKIYTWLCWPPKPLFLLPVLGGRETVE